MGRPVVSLYSRLLAHCGQDLPRYSAFSNCSAPDRPLWVPFNIQGSKVEGQSSNNDASFNVQRSTFDVRRSQIRLLLRAPCLVFPASLGTHRLGSQSCGKTPAWNHLPFPSPRNASAPWAMRSPCQCPRGCHQRPRRPVRSPRLGREQGSNRYWWSGRLPLQTDPDLGRA